MLRLQTPQAPSRSACYTLCLLALLAASCGPDPDPNEVPFVAHLETLVPELMAQYQVPGVAVGLIEDGQTRFMKGFGYADQAQRTAVTPETVFNVGSISKTATAWGVLHLVESGLIDLDAPVQRYLTTWTLPDAPFDAAEVTVRRLLSHTAGVSMRSAQGVAPLGEIPPPLEQVLTGEGAGFAGVRLSAAPGTAWRYSGGGYGVLQWLVETVSGSPFATYMEEAVFQPLGMKHARFSWGSSLPEHAAIPYHLTGRRAAHENFSLSAAAGLQLNLVDFSTFVAAHFPSPAGAPAGRGVLKPETVALMLAPDAESDSTYGLGYFMEYLPGGDHAVGHDGSNTGWNAIFQILPEREAGFMVLTNSSHGQAVTNRIRRAWYEWKTGEDAPPEYYSPPLTTELLVALYSGGVPAALERYQTLKAEHPDLKPSEGYLNFLGYDLLSNGEQEGAVELFKLIVALFPESTNAHDSLAEGYEAVGQRALALERYQHILTLDPDNTEARADVLRLQQQQ